MLPMNYTPSGGTPSAPGGGSWPNGGLLHNLVNDLTQLIYGGRIIEAQEKMYALQAQERRKVLDALTEIAVSTTDNQLKTQMFQMILMLEAKLF